MSMQSAKAIIFYATGTGGGSTIPAAPGVISTLAVAGATPATNAALSFFDVGISSRITLGIVMGTSTAVTNFKLQVYVENTNLYSTTTGYALTTGGVVDPMFTTDPGTAANPGPALFGTVAQNSTSPFILATAQNWNPATVTADYVQVTGPLVGKIAVRVTTTGAGSYLATDFFKVSLDAFTG